jgi:hypothetical protein
MWKDNDEIAAGIQRITLKFFDEPAADSLRRSLWGNEEFDYVEAHPVLIHFFVSGKANPYVGLMVSGNPSDQLAFLYRNRPAGTDSLSPPLVAPASIGGNRT